MEKFSPAGNLMFIRQEGSNFIFYCPKTNYTEPATEKDFKVFQKEHTLKTTDLINEYSNLGALCNDITIPKVFEMCDKSPECKGKKQKIAQIRNKDLTITNICCKCNKIWKS